MSTPRKRRHPPASPEDRALAEAVAQFNLHALGDEANWLVRLAVVAREFPGIRLEVALAAHVFGKLLLRGRLQ